MKVKDAFKTKTNVLREFGFEGKSLQKALWPIPNQTNRFVWVAHRGQYLDGRNELSLDGMHFTDRRDDKKADSATYGHHKSFEVERFLFLKTPRFGKEILMFEGVFKPDVQRSVHNVSAWIRVSDECTVPEGSWVPSNGLI